jgi:hypothetical protein
MCRNFSGPYSLNTRIYIILAYFVVVLGFELRALCLTGDLSLEPRLQPILLWLFFR